MAEERRRDMCKVKCDPTNTESQIEAAIAAFARANKFVYESRPYVEVLQSGASHAENLQLPVRIHN